MALYLVPHNQVFKVLSTVNSDAEGRLSTDEDWPSWVPQMREYGPKMLISAAQE
jgi:hypothetical protein